MGSPEPPLTERELRILRGMIDDHETHRIRRGMWGEWWKDGRIFFAGVGFVVLVTLEVFQIIASFHGH